MASVIGEAVECNVVRGVIAAEHLAFAFVACSIDGCRLVHILSSNRSEDDVLDIGKGYPISFNDDSKEKKENLHVDVINERNALISLKAATIYSQQEQ